MLIAFRPAHRIVIIVGGNILAASRAFAALKADAKAIVVAKSGIEGACEEVRWRASQNQFELFGALSCSTAGLNDSWRDDKALDSFIYRQPIPPAMVCITDPVVTPSGTAAIMSPPLLLHANVVTIVFQ